MALSELELILYLSVFKFNRYECDQKLHINLRCPNLIGCTKFINLIMSPYKHSRVWDHNLRNEISLENKYQNNYNLATIDI